MSYSLNTTIINSSDKQKPENAVILCHGYGGDGKDISILANYWRAHLPNTIFICPDAPEKCAASPSGFQWFDLMDQTEDEILSKSLIAEAKLNNFIDVEVFNNNTLLGEIEIQEDADEEYYLNMVFVDGTVVNVEEFSGIGTDGEVFIQTLEGIFSRFIDRLEDE